MTTTTIRSRSRRRALLGASLTVGTIVAVALLVASSWVPPLAIAAVAVALVGGFLATWAATIEFREWKDRAAQEGESARAAERDRTRVFHARQREVLASFRGLNGAPSFSPDGKFMLFTASMHGNPEIYQMNLQSRQIQRMTNDSAIDTEARYAPDGKSFIFTSDRGGSAQIYRYSFEEDSVKRLTFKGAFNARGTLSADGKKIALVHRPSGSNYKVALQDITTGITNILTPTSLDEAPSFSPNGQMVVYATREGHRGLLSIMSTDGRFRMNLPSEQGEVREPAWAPK